MRATESGNGTGWPCFDEEMVEAAARVLRSGKVNYWTGEECRAFEREYGARLGIPYAIALANGTVALEAALAALGIGPGDEVITTSRTFIASASCAVMRGARPILADVDPVSQNITAETIHAVLTPRVKAVIAVHLAGWPCDMDPILDLAREHGLHVIEDCAQANGALYRSRPVGTMGTVGAFSFCQDKIISTGGEGGLVATRDADLWNRMWSMKDHGKSWRAVYETEWHGHGFRWLHESFGTNWRMTEVQGALGRVQLRRLPAWVEQRRRNAAALTERFAELPALRVTIPPPDVHHSYYKYYCFVRPERLRPGWSRDRVMEEVATRSVACQSGSCSEIYREKAFEGIRPPARLPVARELGETSLMFQVHPTLGEADMRRVADAVADVLEEATA